MPGALVETPASLATTVREEDGLVCSSMLERPMSSVFVNMWRPSYPVKIFEDMDAARR